MEIGLGFIVIISVFLYDVVEDIDVILVEIRDMFGLWIVKIVDGFIKLDFVYNVESL